MRFSELSFLKKSLVFKLCHLMYYLHQHKKESVLLGYYVMPSAFYLQWKRGFVEAFMVIIKSWIKALDFKHLAYLCFVSSLLVNFCLWDKLSCVPGWLQILCVAKDDLEFLIFLPLPPQFGDYRLFHRSWFMQYWGLTPKLHAFLASCVPTDLYPQP